MKTTICQLFSLGVLVSGGGILLAVHLGNKTHDHDSDIALVISSLLVIYFLAIEFFVRFILAEGARWDRVGRVVYNPEYGLPRTEIPINKFLPMVGVFFMVLQWIPATLVGYFDYKAEIADVLHFSMVFVVLLSYACRALEYFTDFPAVYIHCGQQTHAYPQGLCSRFRDGVILQCNQLHCNHNANQQNP